MHEDRQAPAKRDNDIHQTDPRHADASQALGAGARVDRFDIVDLIGAGASGFVYLAFDHALGRHVALREYLPRKIAQRGPDGIVQPASSQQSGLFAAGLRSFASEALVLARIESPSLAKVLRYWEGNGTGYAVMPFYEGMTLERAVHERRLAVDDVMLRALLAQLLDAVEAVHRAQSCHGNISPSAILIRADGRPLLLEFDAAGTVLAEMTDTVPAMLKAGFAPVELYPGMKDMLPGAWSDIYALGAVAWFLITGKVPPPAPERLRHDDMRSARESGHGKFSPGLLDAIDRALSVRLEQRPASAAAMRELLGAGRAPGAYTARADHGRDAIRRDRETMTTHTAQQPDAPQAAQASRAPLMPETPPASGTPRTPDVPLAAAAAPAAPAPRPQPVQADVPPIQGEWRKLPMVADRREFPRRRSRLSSLLLGAATLCTGVAAGVLIGYPELVMPIREKVVAPSSTSSGPSTASAPVPTTDKTAHAAAASASPAQTAAHSPAPPPAPATPTPAAPQPARAQPPQPAPAAHRPEETRPGPHPRKTAAADDPAPPKEQETLAAEHEEWRIASSIDQPEFYENYLKRFPDGPNAAAARTRLSASRQAGASAARTGGAATATPSGPPIEERSARATTASVSRIPDAPRYSADAMSTTSRAEAATSGTSGTSRTIRSEGQTLSGDFSADPDSGVLSGSGQVTWANGDRYEGRLVNGSKEGKGQYVWRNGQRYNGDWSDNQPNGRGTIVFADGNRYDGEIRNGVPNGRGVLAFKAGGRYDGEVRNGVPHGRGLMVFADGTRYEGEVRDGLPHGQGVTRFRNGDVYSGTLVKGVSHGQGRFSWANGLVWEGEFRDGLRTNNGRLIGQSRTVASSGATPASAGNAGE